MEDIRKQTFRLRSEITGEVGETNYTVIFTEEDNEIPGLVWIYLESQFGDENVEREVKFINGTPTEICYAKVTNNSEGLLV